MIQTTYRTKASEIKRNWHTLDASGVSLGRLASQTAILLRGKSKVNYTPQLDMGDFVIITNASKVKITGNKLQNEMHRRFTGYLGGMKEFTTGFMLERRPHFLVEQAVRCMLPKGPLGKQMLTKLRVYAGAEHKHRAQIATPAQPPMPIKLQSHSKPEAKPASSHKR